MKNYFYIFFIFCFSVFLISCGKQKVNSTEKSNSGISDTTSNKRYAIEFVELGSVNCIPCKKMQVVMKSIEEKYKGLVKVTFYDVWKDEAPGKKFGIDLIPTQVFLDTNGKEIFRHEGFFAEEEIDKFFKSQGINIPQ